MVSEKIRFLSQATQLDKSVHAFFFLRNLGLLRDEN
jgi:hypothetical protein